MAVDAIAIIRPTNDNRQRHDDIALNSFQFSTKNVGRNQKWQRTIYCPWLPLNLLAFAFKFFVDAAFFIAQTNSSFFRSCPLRLPFAVWPFRIFLSPAIADVYTCEENCRHSVRFASRAFFFARTRSNYNQLLALKMARIRIIAQCTHCLRMTNDNAIIAPDTNTYALEWTKFGDFRFFLLKMAQRKSIRMNPRLVGQ